MTFHQASASSGKHRRVISVLGMLRNREPEVSPTAPSLCYRLEKGKRIRDIGLDMCVQCLPENCNHAARLIECVTEGKIHGHYHVNIQPDNDSMPTTVARFFLAFVGLMYLGLGLWCAIAPEKTSKSVGFELRPGQGQSEFLTVYGGLEVALGLMFLWPLYRSEDVMLALAACLAVHACLVLFRTVGFFLYTGFESTTYTLAAGEWILFLTSGAIYLWNR